MPTVHVNGKPVEIGDKPQNLIQAAQAADVEIPHYCWHAALSVVASCRMCLVEVGEKKPDGSIAMQPKLLPACQTPAKDGTVVVTDSEKVRQAQKATLEYLLLNHPLDCPTCDQAGECFLQDYSYRYGRAESRLQEPKIIRPDKPHIGEHITLFTDRCVMCSRCVRFTREFTGTAELQVVNRGSHSEIDIFPGQPCNNKLAGNVVELCPVGALCNKDFLYQQRVWWLRTFNSVCPNCSTGCATFVDQNKDKIYRLRARFNPQSNGYFMCDEGRFGFHYVNSENRLNTPAVDLAGVKTPTTWESIIPAVRTVLEDTAAQNPSTIAAVISPWVTVEEAYLLARFLKGLSSSTKLALGPVPVVGEDDTYPKDPHGNPAQPVRFTIRAEKCPNRLGVQAILDHYEENSLSLDDILDQVEQGVVTTVYLVGGYPEPWITADQAARLKNFETLIVQDLFPSPASEAAKYILPAGSFAEKDGTFVNHAGLAQAIHRAINSEPGVRADGRIFWDLTRRRGLFNAAVLREEIGREVPAFAGLVGDLGEFGVMLPQLSTQPQAAAAK